MTNNLIPLTVFTSKKGVLTKTITRHHGKFHSEAPKLNTGLARTVWVKLIDLPEFIKSLKISECFTLGVFDLSDEVTEVLTVGEFDSRGYSYPLEFNPTGRYGTRTKKAMQQSQRTLLFFDYDPDPSDPNIIEKPEQFISLLDKAVPELSLVDTTYVRTYSTSRGLYRKSDDTCLRPANGFHIYFEIEDGDDIERFTKMLERRCWNSGLGHIKISSNGQLLERVIFDKAVFQPERMCFEAGAFIPEDQDFYQKLPDAEYIEKPLQVLDTHKVVDLTVDELRDIEMKIAKIKHSGRVQDLLVSYRERASQQKMAQAHLTGRLMTRREAYEQVVNEEQLLLHPEDVLYFADGRTSTVRNSLIHSEEYDGCGLKDPIRLDKGYSKAKFYANRDQAQIPHPAIHSFINGGRIFKLEDAVEYYDNREKIEQSSLASLCDMPEVVDSKYLPDFELKKGLTLIKSAKGTGKTTALAKRISPDQVARAINISQLVSLVGALCIKFELDNYNDLQSEEGRSLHTAARLGICLNSVHKIRGNRYDVVILDEFTQLLRAIKSSTVRYPAACLQVIKEVIAAADYVVCMDADLTPEYVEMFRHPEFGLISNDVKINVVENLYRPPAVEERQVVLYQDFQDKPDHAAFTEKVVDTGIKEGKGFFYAGNSKGDVIKKASLLVGQLGGDEILEEEHFITEVGGRRVITITSNNSQLKETQDFIKNLNHELRPDDMFLSSPSMGTGHSIDTVDGLPLFDICFGYFTSRAGNLPSDCTQHISRVRGCKNLHVIFTQVNLNLSEDKTILMNQHIYGRSNMVDSMSAFNKFGKHVMDKMTNSFKYEDFGYANWYVDLTSHENKIKNRFGLNLLIQLETEGYHIDRNYCLDYTGNGRGHLAEMKLTAEAMKELERERLWETPLVSDHEFEGLKECIYQTPEEKRKLFKKRQANYFGFEEDSVLLNQIVTSSAVRLSGLKAGVMLGADPIHLFVMDVNNRLDHTRADKDKSAYNKHYGVLKFALSKLGVTVVNGLLESDGRAIRHENKYLFTEAVLERSMELKILHGLSSSADTEEKMVAFASRFLTSVGLKFVTKQVREDGVHVRFSRIDPEALALLNLLIAQAQKASKAPIFNEIDELSVGLYAYSIMKDLPMSVDRAEFKYIRSFPEAFWKALDAYLESYKVQKIVA